MNAELRPMSAADLPAVLNLWNSTEGVGLNEADSPPRLQFYLERNPGLSLVAVEAGKLVAAVLCGHDGRRGYLNHLAVAKAARGRGLGRRIVERCLAALAALNIARCNIFLYVDNEPGGRFWEHCGWAPRNDLQTWQRSTKYTDSIIPAAE